MDTDGRHTGPTIAGALKRWVPTGVTARGPHHFRQSMFVRRATTYSVGLFALVSALLGAAGCPLQAPEPPSRTRCQQLIAAGFKTATGHTIAPSSVEEPACHPGIEASMSGRLTLGHDFAVPELWQKYEVPQPRCCTDPNIRSFVWRIGVEHLNVRLSSDGTAEVVVR